MKLDISLDRQSDVSLSEQLYRQLRQLILEGKLVPGSKIPSSRELADQLKVARPTIAATFSQLSAEGYLDIRASSGTYVSDALKSVHDARSSHQQPVSQRTLSSFGRFIRSMTPLAVPDPEPEMSLYPWQPALDQFPITEWARILGRQARSTDIAMLDVTCDPQGELPLRKAIAQLVERFRAVSCDPEQVILTAGLHQGIDLVARLHLNAGGSAVVQNPGYPPAWQIFQSSGAKLVPVPVGDEGFDMQQLGKIAQANLVYVMPAHQFPTGAMMSVSQRLAFLHWARRAGALVLEDDYDSEYQAEGKPMPSLMSLDETGCVIYLGTLNQLMFPSLALGFLILPPDLVPLYRQARHLIGAQLPPPVQIAVAEFIKEGNLDRHVRRLRALYNKRRQALIEALHKHLDGKVQVSGDRAGVFVVAHLPSSLSGEQICADAYREGVGVITTKSFYRGKGPNAELLLGFGALPEKKIAEAVKRLARVIKKQLETG